MTAGGPPAGRRERAKATTRAALVDAALRLFAERGYDRTGTQAVARAAAVSQRTFYRYFPSKADLAVAVHEERQEEVLRRVVACPDVEPVWNTLVSASRAATEALGEQRSAAHAHVLRLADTAPELRGALLAADRRFAERVERAVLARVADPSAELRVRLTVAAFCAVDQVAARTWLEGAQPGPAARSEAQRRCGELLLTTLATSTASLA